MSEKDFRIILGAWLLVGLLLNSPLIIHALIALLLFEGVTNLRVPGLVTRVRYGGQAGIVTGNEALNRDARTSFEAERALRIIVAVLIIVPMMSTLKLLWLLPWFVGFALIGAGLSGICPMVLALRWLGMR